MCPPEDTVDKIRQDAEVAVEQTEEAIPADAMTTKAASVLERLESFLARVDPWIAKSESLAALIPGAEPIVAAIDEGIKLTEAVIEQIDGSTIDGAAMAAQAISVGTGDPVLDMRLQSIESHIEEYKALAPLLKLVLQKLGIA